MGHVYICSVLAYNGKKLNLWRAPAAALAVFSPICSDRWRKHIRPIYLRRKWRPVIMQKVVVSIALPGSQTIIQGVWERQCRLRVCHLIKINQWLLIQWWAARGRNGATRRLLPPYRGVRSMQLCSIRAKRKRHFLPHSVVIQNCHRHLSPVQSVLFLYTMRHLLLFFPQHLCSILTRHEWHGDMIAWRWWIRLFCRHAEGLTSRGRALLMSKHPALGSFSARFSFSRIPKCSQDNLAETVCSSFSLFFLFYGRGRPNLREVLFSEQKNCPVYIKRALFHEWPTPK